MSQADEETIEQQVVRYQASRSLPLRDRIVERSKGYIDFTAETLARKSSTLGILDVDDLKAAGAIGVMRAAGSFDIGRGFKFSTYAVSYIRGAMLDALREQDWTPRLERLISNSITKAADRLGRQPSWAEVGDVMHNKSIGNRTSDVSDFGITKVSSLSAVFKSNNGGLRAIDNLVDPCGDAGQRAFEANDAFRGLIRHLPSRRHRFVIALYYESGMTMREIGRAIGTSESRVSQIHSEAINCLKSNLTRAAA